MAIPKRLKNAPLIEAIWQMQFNVPGAGDILAGQLYKALQVSHPHLKHTPLPTINIPPIVADMDPNLRFAPKIRLEDPDSSFLWQIGNRVVTVNCRAPYAGWERFKEEIVQTIGFIRESGLIQTTERHSLRYIDLITLEPAPDLSSLQLSIKLGRFQIGKNQLQMRVELSDDGVGHVVQISTPTKVGPPGGQREGTIIDLESYTPQEKSWEAMVSEIESLHDRSKTFFFEQILTSHAIERMEPEY
ncbi:MAG: TIGR04255 family protein [Acidithiobacillus sp.]